ncbi:hypothetical protein J422_04333 [Methanocaldococcus villosus KIN24-T80]|uniref:Integral membrane protein n=1 Tax=Methanocaldococcus villosus KIN24-T80 TaxID=1069083 RepID=N6V1D6_9EURY|nr:TIGR00297 family protein [Methanocaldococcus villosus]ENN96068.1 hypothetical protein J422_04333 [Methanocaldococcus villosus KIN24-T80]
MNLLLSTIIVIILALLVKKSKCLDNKGILLASIMAFILIYFCGLEYLIVLLSFFILGSLVSRVGLKEKKKKKIAETCRGLNNVIANGLIPMFFAILSIKIPIFLIAYISSIAAATSDTFSSEIGVLSKEKPRLVTTFEVVEKGTDGAITLLGTFAGLFGAFLIALIGTILFNNIKLLLPVTLAGLIGNLADSLFGALFERKGLASNEHTNLVATLVGGVFGIIFYLIL